MSARLSSCPFCGAGETIIHVNKGTWNGMGYGEPVSVEVRHWCEEAPGQPSRAIVRVGRDQASAIAAWNQRAQRKPLTDALGPLRAWWAMNEAQWELCEETPEDDAIILHFMGSGASTAVTAGQLRAALGITPNRQDAGIN